MVANKALRVNPFIVNGRTVDIHITVDGSDWYWTVMSVMGITMLAILGTGMLRRPSDRIFHYILGAVAFIAMLESFSLASNLGWVPIDVEWLRHDHRVAGVNRQIWWVRYCGWFLVWPLISLALLLTTAAPAVHILWTCFLSAVMAIMAVGGALVRSDYKWGYFAFWLWTWLLIGYHLLWAPRNFANRLGPKVRFVQSISSIWVWVLWMLYPICWGVSEGGNVISPDSEFIFYGILDLCLIPVTAAFFLACHWSIDPATLGVAMRTYEDPIPSHKHIWVGKQTPARNGVNGVNGVNGHNATASGAGGQEAAARGEPVASA